LQALYDWLLFLHVLAGFALVVTVVMFTAFALGAPLTARAFSVANALWAVGGIGTIVLGIWLALDIDGYELWDGWILGAIVLWAIATELGRRAQEQLTPLVEGAGGGEVDAGPTARQAAMWHWLRAIAVLLILFLMIFKPGA
jgi:hypothetical protein